VSSSVGEPLERSRWVDHQSVLLLTRVSGVRLLEKRADEKWGGQDDCEAYKERTPVLIPLPPASTSGRGR